MIPAAPPGNPEAVVGSYVLIVFDRCEPGTVAAVLGTYPSRDAAQQARRDLHSADLEQRFRKTCISPVETSLPAYAS